MRQEDNDFLNSVADERIQFHYAEHLKEIQPDRTEFTALEENFRAAIKPLSKEANESVQAYLDYLFCKSAVTEMVLYKGGVLDGYRLAKLIQKLE